MKRLAAGAAILMTGALAISGPLPATGRPAVTGRPAAARRPAAAPARAAKPPTRYSLVHGCYWVRGPSGHFLAPGVGPFRMQAAALGEYLLYGGHRDYLDSSFRPVAAPRDSTVWGVDGSARRGFTLTNLATGSATRVRFVRASGCAVYPEALLDATGTSFTGTSPEATVKGTIDAHTHVTAFEFLGGDWHCGRPWHRFGAPFAMPDCAPNQQGANGQIESFEDYGTPAHKHDTKGWPTFRDWPSPTALAEEGDYYTGMKRAWMAGVRVMVTQLVDNEALCTLMTTKHNPCNDMASVRIQARDLRELQGYIDAQSGGPGKGFFRIVTNPFQARRVVNQGKLAVVEGIEVSHVLNCGEYLGVPDCSKAKIDAGLKEIRALGVSTFFPIHKFDNAFGGTKMDGGETGLIVNVGNHYETGQFWDVQTCTGPEHDNEQLTGPPAGALATLLNGPLASMLHGTPLPAYPPPPHCNVQGLTSLGAYLINRMIKQRFIVELDHMDAKMADQTLSILEAHHYSGVISAHSWDSPQENPRVYNLGGFVTPIANSPGSFVSDWRASRKIRNSKYYSGAGFGYGADMNGLHSESGPLAGNPITYPFKSFDGRVTFGREVWGQRVFDINKNGVANYGMFPDWMQGLQVVAGRGIVADMFRGSEAYLQMWERAVGVPGPGCRPARGVLGAGKLRLGISFRSLLYGEGQPSGRPGRSYRYCVKGGRKLVAVFGARGHLELLITNATGYRAHGFGVHVGRWHGVTSARGAALKSDLRAAGV